jgi:hypothetical protein
MICCITLSPLKVVLYGTLVTYDDAQANATQGDRVESPQNQPLTPERALVGLLGMSNVLSEEKNQQVIAIGTLGWSQRRIEEATGVRRETASAYLKTAGVCRVPAWMGTPSAGKTGHSDPDFIAPFSQKQGVSPPLNCGTGCRFYLPTNR